MTIREGAQMLGHRGGVARAERLTVAERKRIASLGGTARSASLEAARRIASNLRYVAAMRELGRHPPTVRRTTVHRRLPGIYPTHPQCPTPQTTSTTSRRSSTR